MIFDCWICCHAREDWKLFVLWLLQLAETSCLTTMRTTWPLHYEAMR